MLRQSSSIDEQPELVDDLATVKPDGIPDVCPEGQLLHLLNIHEPDVVRSSSSSSGNFSRVSSFASTSSSERSFNIQGGKLKFSLACTSQNSLEEEEITTSAHDTMREKKWLIKERRIDNSSQDINDDVFEAIQSSPAPFHGKERNRFFNDSSVLSEKGQRKRSEFSSRGYGTGSGGSAQENSVSKNSTDSSSNSETVVAEMAGATVAKTVQLTAVENDFKPKSLQRMSAVIAIPVDPPPPDQSSAMQALNDHAKESLLCDDLSQEDSSQMFGNSKEPSSFASPTVCKTVSTSSSTSSRSKLKAVNDSSSLLFPLSLTSAPVTSSSSGNGSFYINSSDENKLLASNSAAMPEVNDSAKKSLLCVDLGQEVSSQKGSSCSASSATWKTLSITSRSHFKALNDGYGVLFPTSLSSAPIASSSSSSGSFYINSSDESKLHTSNADSLLKAICSSSVPGNSVMSSVSKYPLEDLLNGNYPYCGTKHQANLSSFSTSESHFPTSTLFVDNELATVLEKSGRCEEEICDDYQCQQIKSRIKELSNGGLKATALNEEQKSLLYHMCRHVKECTLPKCPFSWCEPSSIEENLSEEEQLFFMKRKLENFTDDKMLHGHMVEFLKMYPKLPYDDLPIEQLHWSRLCMLENSSRAVLAAHNQPEGLEYWVIKKNLVDDDFLWKVCTQLGKLSCNTCVVQMLWAAKFETHVLICSRFEGYHSLQDSLKASAPFGLDLGLTQFLMLQLTSATQHLHSLGIVYLNWTSGNILSYQSDQGIVVKLCNFSAAARLDSYDIGFLKLALPTYILMPELCNEDRVTLGSDVWGLGCILYELVTGHPLWHEQRHVSSEILYKMMKEKFSTLASDSKFNLSDVSPQMSPVLSACWEVDPSKRLNIIDLQLQLIETFLSSNPSNVAT